MYAWNYTETVWAIGDFAQWYYRWAKIVVYRLKLHYKIIAFPLGSSLSELQEAFPDEIEVFSSSNEESRAIIRNTNGHFTLDDSDTLISLWTPRCMRDG